MATLTRDSNIIRLYDMQHTPTPLGDETEPTIIERSVHPCDSQIGSFAWHPFSQNRMVVVSAANRAMTDFIVFERISLAWSPTTSLMWACGRHLYRCVEDGPEGAESLAEKDIATKMRQRAQSRYGHDTAQLWRNHLLAGGKDPQLKSLWFDLFYILLCCDIKGKRVDLKKKKKRCDLKKLSPYSRLCRLVPEPEPVKKTTVRPVDNRKQTGLVLSLMSLILYKSHI